MVLRSYLKVVCFALFLNGSSGPEDERFQRGFELLSLQSRLCLGDSWTRQIGTAQDTVLMTEYKYKVPHKEMILAKKGPYTLDGCWGSFLSSDFFFGLQIIVGYTGQSNWAVPVFGQHVQNK